jgi:chemotaxis signal transduction protein
VISTRDPAEVLKARARALAIRDESELQREVEELATFAIGGHLLGVPMSRVSRAAALKHLTEIPGGPPWLVGLTAVEGHLVSLLDLAVFLDLGRRGVGDVTGAIIVSANGREIGLAAEHLLGIEDVPVRAIAPLPDGKVHESPLDRVARLPGREMLLLDVQKLFDDPRLHGATHG